MERGLLADKLLERLRAGNLTLLVEREGRLAFASDRSGLKPLFRGFLEHPEVFEGSDVADRVVGLAAAYLLGQARVKRVVTPLISREAEKALASVQIPVEFESKVKQIHDTPEGFEALAREAGTPARFVELLRQKLG